MSFLRRLKGNRASKVLNQSQATLERSNNDISYSSVDNSANQGPLAGFKPLAVCSESVVDLGQSSTLNKPVKQRSRLSKTLQEVLHDPSALGYFIQSLEARDAVQLVKFWLDVESFRCSASAVITSNYVPPQVSRERLEIVHELQEVSLAQDEAQRDKDSCGSVFFPNLPDSLISTYSFDSGFERSERDSNKSMHDSVGDTSVGSSSRLEEDDIQSPTDSESGKVDISSALSNPSLPSRAEHFLQTRTEDAVNIYRRYIAPDCQRPVHLPTEYKKDIVELICAETGHVTANCFDIAQNKVVEILETEYFPDFLKSEYHVKHQVDVLTSGQVNMTDVLYNDTALFHFMEFLDLQGQRSLIEFWLASSNFQQITGGDNSQGDAMVLYDKYFSMQATTPLGFSDEIRLEIEDNICTEGGPDNDCFHRPLEITVQFLEQKYLQKFLASHLYRNYVKELISSIQSSPVSQSVSCHNLSVTSRRTDSDTHSTCSSDLSSDIPRVNNTLLAGMSSYSRSEGRVDSLLEIVDNPDLIWKRKGVRNKVGRVNSFGRYIPGLDLAPDMTREQGTQSRGSRLGRVVKKLVNNDQHEKLKEEMAWEVAEMIVKDVTSVTMPNSRQSGKSGDCGENIMTKSVSESHSLKEFSLEIPTAKYF